MRSYRASPTKRHRRTKSQISDLRAALYNLLWDERPMTVRQVFYRAVSFGLIPKSEAAYKNVICRLLGDTRRVEAAELETLATVLETLTGGNA